MKNVQLEEKITNSVLTDSFGRVHHYLRISLTDRCNLRCAYCMPQEDIHFSSSEKLMKAEEIYSLANTFVHLGIKKIRLTGGEPLLRADARKIITLLSTLPVDLTITTNATQVHNFIDDLLAAGIRSVNVSLDTFDRNKFLHITRRDSIEEVLSNVHLLLLSSLQVKLNVVLVRGVNDDELCDFIEFTRHYPIHVRFIEFMPFPGNGWSREKVVTYRQALSEASSRYIVQKLEDEKNSTAKKFHVPGYAGTFAFINTVTLPFCSDCNRLRLTADGRIKNCLFSKDEIDLLSALRRGEDIQGLIFSSLKNKKKLTGGQDFSHPTENRSMIAIGG